MAQLQIPANTQVYEQTNSSIWFDEDGVLYSRPHDGPFVDISEESIISEIDQLLKLTNGKKVCIVVESHPQSPPVKKEQREFISTQINRVTKAMAVLSPNALTRAIANIFFLIKTPPYPTRLCSNVSEAKNWIMKFVTDKNQAA